MFSLGLCIIQGISIIYIYIEDKRNDQAIVMTIVLYSYTTSWPFRDARPVATSISVTAVISLDFGLCPRRGGEVRVEAAVTN